MSGELGEKIPRAKTDEPGRTDVRLYDLDDAEALLVADAEDDDPSVREGSRRRMAVLAHLRERAVAASRMGEEAKAAQDEYEPMLVLVKCAADARTGPFTICVDLDGTLAEKEEPFSVDTIGAPISKAVEWVRRFRKAGARIIVFTVRGDAHQVAKWLDAHDVPYDYINENPDQPSDASHKLRADVYWDDKAYNARDPDEHGPSILSQAEAHESAARKNDDEEDDVAEDETGDDRFARIVVRRHTVITISAPMLLDELCAEN